MTAPAPATTTTATNEAAEWSMPIQKESEVRSCVVEKRQGTLPNIDILTHPRTPHYIFYRYSSE